MEVILSYTDPQDTIVNSTVGHEENRSEESNYNYELYADDPYGAAFWLSARNFQLNNYF